MNGFTAVIVAYSLIWIAFCAYYILLGSKVSNLEKRIAKLEDEEK